MQIYNDGLFRFFDDRGSLQRVFEQNLFSDLGLSVAQSSLSITQSKGTLRGLHSMATEANEWKLVTCCVGEVWDVAVDTRADSPTFGAWQSSVLSPEAGNYGLIPPGWSHGYISLEDNCVVAYAMSVEFNPALEVGYRWDSPLFSIDWPLQPSKISDKDANFTRL